MNLVTGTHFTAEFPVFTGSFTSPKFSHKVTVEAVVKKESYGLKTGQHTFSFEVLSSSDEKNFAVGKVYKKMGRNLYPNITAIVAVPENLEQLAREKSNRASVQAARVRRDMYAA